MQPADDLQRLASDVTSSATALLATAYRLLAEATDRGASEAERAAVSVCRAQPSMGSFWNLSAAALTSRGALDRFYRRATRAPEAIARYAGDLAREPEQIRRVVTCSSSAAVAAAIKSLPGLRPLVVRCAESRPGYEGRELAGRLAAERIHVELVTDAAIASDLQPGDLVLVGADAVASDWFVNKAGTGQLCAAALLASVPAYVVAGREKFVAPPISDALRLREGEPADVWRNPPDGVAVRNPLFERVPLDRVAGVLTDAGLLAGPMIAAACEAAAGGEAAHRLCRAVLSF